MPAIYVLLPSKVVEGFTLELSSTASRAPLRRRAPSRGSLAVLA
jgi:hypothetical protein